jgi:predicted DCC family thiol-disulfide oxidoreductase YuxK
MKGGIYLDKTTNAIVLFDGVCNFCNNSVKFIIERDPDAYFSFASMQGSTGQEVLRTYHLDDYFGSFVLIDNGKLYLKSSAALRICKHLKGFWKIGYFFLIVPVPIRDFFYNFIASNRYKWFGKRESCMLPSPDIRNRYLD